MFLVPRSNILMKLHLSGEFTAKEYAYAVALKKFAYYFFPQVIFCVQLSLLLSLTASVQENDDLKSLLNEFKSDPAKKQKVLQFFQKSGDQFCDRTDFVHPSFDATRSCDRRRHREREIFEMPVPL